MRSTFFALTAVLVVLPNLAAEQPVPEPYNLAGLAIRAHGGVTNIEKYRAEFVKFQGKMHRDGKETAVSGECLLQMPNQFKQVVRFEADGKLHETVAAFDGTKGWRQRDGSTESMNGIEILQAKDRLHSHNLARLTPLFRDRAFQPALLESKITINGVHARGINVSCKGEKDTVIWISEDKNQVVKIDRVLQIDSQKTAKIEEFFSEFKEVGGVLRPTQRSTVVDGKKAVDLKIVEIKLYEQVGAKMFEKP